MKKILLPINLLIFLNCFAQTKTDCSKLLSQKINTELNKKNFKIVKNNLLKLTNCGIDTIDIRTFVTGPMLGELMIEKANKNKEITYQDIYDKLIDFKNSPDYKTFIDHTRDSDELSNRIGSIKNWKDDKKLMAKVLMTGKDIKKFYSYLKEHPNNNKTYADISKIFKNEVKKSQIPLKNNIFDNPKNYKFSDLLKRSRKENKSVILYFTGFSAINCRKIEAQILSQDSIAEKLKNDYILVYLFVDYRKELPKSEQYKDKTGKLIKTIGNKYAEWETDKFGKNYQPYFAMLNQNGKLISEQTYNTNLNKFRAFLKTEK